MRPIPGTVTDPALGHLLSPRAPQPQPRGLHTLWYGGIFRVVRVIDFVPGKWEQPLLLVDELVRGEHVHATPQPKTYEVGRIERLDSTAAADAIAALRTP